jgi:NAD(P)-dependent dehydrogenase (short-subunit alcohol dehydrogenase family)
LPDIKELGNDYFNTTKIACDALNQNSANARYNKKNNVKVVINAHGWVMPCNFFNHNLHDARFRDRSVLPSSNDLSFLPNGKNQIRDLFDRHNASDELNINNKTLDEIFKNSFWDEILDSFNKPLGKGRLFECAMTCGDKLSKVWDQTMKKTFLVTGGNKGFGLEVINHYNGTSVSRTENRNNDIIADITSTVDIERIANESLKYDVFVNSAFDGPPGNPWANFAQVNLLIRVYETWKEHNKTGHIINIGSVGEKRIVAPDPDFERYRISKAALSHASKQCTMAFKDNLVPFKTSLLTPDRMDTPMVRDRPSWTGNGLDCNDLIKTIDYIMHTNPNTCVEEVTLWVNYNFASSN